MADIKVSKAQISQVFSTKKGLHEFLTIEMEFCLPPLPYTNIDWLCDIWKAEKKVSASLKHLGLTLIL